MRTGGNDRTGSAVALATAVVKTGVQIWAGPLAAVTGSVADMIRSKVDDRLQQRKIERMFDECVDAVAGNTVKMLDRHVQRVAEHEIVAAIEAVRDTFDEADLARGDLIANDLDARRLERALQPAESAVLARAGLDAIGENVYRLVLRESCAYLVEFVTTLPTFQGQVFAEVLRRHTAITESLERVLDRLPARRSMDDFEGDYCRLVANKYDRLSLLGVSAPEEASRRYPLSVAYISLTATWRTQDDADATEYELPAIPEFAPYGSPTALGDALRELSDTRRVKHDRPPERAPAIVFRGPGPGLPDLQHIGRRRSMSFIRHLDHLDDTAEFELDSEPERAAADTSVEVTLSDKSRVMIVGEAGSGKTTLLQWLAVRSARRDFDEPMSAWNACVPFFLPLRQFADRGLPDPEDFPGVIGSHIADEMPSGWVHTILRQGAGLVLIDGIDELREGPARAAAREWLDSLVSTFPRARYVVTSRPAAVGHEWDGWNGFATADLQPMRLPQIRLFVEQWHQAMRTELSSAEGALRLDGDQLALLTAIETDRHLRALSVNPLLCALLCALNRERGRQLPRDRMGVYRAALDMLIESRDRMRGVYATGLLPDQAAILLQDLALFLVRNSWSDTSVERAADQLGRSLRTLDGSAGTAEQVLRHLLERSGLLRQPVVGRIDFVHRSFQEYLAGKAAVDNDDVGFLIARADDDQMRDVIVMAAGHAQPRQANEILRGLIERIEAAGPSDENAVNRLRLLVLLCSQMARQLDPGIRADAERGTSALFPLDSVEIAPAVAAAGDVALDIIAQRPPLTAAQAVVAIRVATLVGGTEAMSAIRDIAKQHSGIENELVRAWGSFDPETYAREVLAQVLNGEVDGTGAGTITIADAGLLPALGHLRWARSLTIKARGLTTMRQLPAQPPQLQRLCVLDHSLRDLDGIEEWRAITHLDLELPAAGVRLRPLRRLERLEALRLRCKGRGTIDLAPLASLQGLQVLQIAHPTADFIKLHPLEKFAGHTIHVPPGVALAGQQKLGTKVVVTHKFPSLAQ